MKQERKKEEGGDKREKEGRVRRIARDGIRDEGNRSKVSERKGIYGIVV